MSGWFGTGLAPALMLGTVLVALPACERDASGLSEWTPADHDHQVEPRRRHPTAPATTNPRAAPSQKNQLIDVTWQKQCASCHGKRGRGDGPSSTMVKARDLSNPEWQASVNDEHLAQIIKHGKDKMPAFNLPDTVVQGLVAHVRSLARKPRDRGAAQTDPDDDTPAEAEAEAEPGATPASAPAAAPNAPAAASSGAAPKANAAAAPADGAHGAASTDTAAQAPTRAPAKQP